MCLKSQTAWIKNPEKYKMPKLVQEKIDALNENVKVLNKNKWFK